MKTENFNIQVNEPGTSWEDTPVKTLAFKDMKAAVDFCYNLSYIVEREIRLTQGNYKLESGTYIKF